MAAEKNYIVYIHINKINNKKYVGITSQKPSYRWRKGKGYCNNKHFFNAIKKYGWDNFYHLIVKENLTKEQAKQWEIYYIGIYQSNISQFGYNLSLGGDLHNKILTPDERKVYQIEYRKKISEKNKNYQKNYRRKHKEELSLKKQEYYKKHKEEICKKAREYRQMNETKIKEYKIKNRKHINEIHNKYYKKHKDKINAKRRENNARKRISK